MDTIEKVVNIGLGVLQGVNNEVKKGLSSIESEINSLILKGEQASDEKSLKIKGFVNRTIDTLQDYQSKAKELSDNFKNYINELDIIGNKRIEELSAKIQALSAKLKK